MTENQPTPNAQPTPPAAAAPAAAQAKPMIAYDDFAKLDLRVGRVLEIKDHPNADKLYVLKVDLGTEQRQIVAGLRPFMPAEALLGREVIIVANLEPRKMRGLDSQGMLLAASHEEAGERKVVFLTPEREVPPGSPIS